MGSRIEMLKPSPELVKSYAALFVNRLAHTVQSFRPDVSGSHRYYRPTDRTTGNAVPLTGEKLRAHLSGLLTIGLYAINPKTQRSKWVAIDADYASAFDDLLKLQWELQRDGVDAALEK